MTYPYPLVEILWDDAAVDTGWDEPPKTLVDQICTTVGFVVSETDQHIVIASTYSEGHVNARIQIPKAIIKSRRILRLASERKRAGKPD